MCFQAAGEIKQQTRLSSPRVVQDVRVRYHAFKTSLADNQRGCQQSIRKIGLFLYHTLTAPAMTVQVILTHCAPANIQGCTCGWQHGLDNASKLSLQYGAPTACESKTHNERPAIRQASHAVCLGQRGAAPRRSSYDLIFTAVAEGLWVLSPRPRWHTLEFINSRELQKPAMISSIVDLLTVLSDFGSRTIAAKT